MADLLDRAEDRSVALPDFPPVSRRFNQNHYNFRIKLLVLITVMLLLKLRLI